MPLPPRQPTPRCEVIEPSRPQSPRDKARLLTEVTSTLEQGERDEAALLIASQGHAYYGGTRCETSAAFAAAQRQGRGVSKN